MLPDATFRQVERIRAPQLACRDRKTHRHSSCREPRHSLDTRGDSLATLPIPECSTDRCRRSSSLQRQGRSQKLFSAGSGVAQQHAIRLQPAPTAFPSESSVPALKRADTCRNREPCLQEQQSQTRLRYWSQLSSILLEQWCFGGASGPRCSADGSLER